MHTPRFKSHRSFNSSLSFEAFGGAYNHEPSSVLNKRALRLDRAELLDLRFPGPYYPFRGSSIFLYGCELSYGCYKGIDMPRTGHEQAETNALERVRFADASQRCPFHLVAVPRTRCEHELWKRGFLLGLWDQIERY